MIHKMVKNLVLRLHWGAVAFHPAKLLLSYWIHGGMHIFFFCVLLKMTCIENGVQQCYTALRTGTVSEGPKRRTEVLK
jgi:hypothetical protein